MLIGEAARTTHLTKKAIEYYAEQGLINPQTGENGYRCFSPEDVEKLGKIATLRNLGLSVTQIKSFLTEKDRGEIQNIIQRKAFETKALQEKEELLKDLAEKGNWEEIGQKAEDLERKNSVLSRLLICFPGFLGQYLTVHFAQFLRDPITTGEQQKAFDTAVSFLDGLKIDLPEELSDFIREITEETDEKFAERMTENLKRAAEDPKTYFEENRETIELLNRMRKTPEYKSSSAFKLNEFFRKISLENGYYDVFIPAMKELSPSYREYHEKLMNADRIFTEEFKN